MFRSMQKNTRKSMTKRQISDPMFKEGEYVKVSKLPNLYYPCNRSSSYHICNPPMHLDDGWYYMVEFGKGNVDSFFIHESQIRK